MILKTFSAVHSLNMEMTEFGASDRRHSPALQWLPALLPVITCAFAARALPPWLYMWLLAAAMFAGAKWVVLAAPSSPRAMPLPALLAWAFAWPGLNLNQFLHGPAAKVSRREWLAAAGKTAFGASIIWGGLRLLPSAPPLLVGWVGMIGIAFLLHFGVFHLLANLWRSVGFGATPMMANPIGATSLASFWGHRWNRAFSDLMGPHVFRPLARRFGATAAIAAVFLVSGILHEMVISVPARGGFGGPTFYFVAQGAGLLFERSAAGQRRGLGRRVRGWLFTFCVTALPAYWLFHPTFVHRVILPLLRALGAF